MVDLCIGFGVLIALIILYRVPITANVLWLPAFLLLAVATALGFGLWLAALNVRYRDVNYLIPFLLQIWMYVTPVVYGTSLIPERFRPLLALNPMTGVVEGFRWALLGVGSWGTGVEGQGVGAGGPGLLTAVSVVITLVVLATGLVFFRSTERTFADVI